jgi:hypothetical protein
MSCNIGLIKSGIESLFRQVCDLEGVAGIGSRYTFGNSRGDAMTERVGIGMSENDECMHGETS